MSRVRAQELYDEGRSGAKSLLTVVADSSAYLSVIAFLRVVAEATTAVLVTLAVARAGRRRCSGRLLISIAIMAVVSFVVVGVSPRTLGRQHYDTVALWAAPFAVGLRTRPRPAGHAARRPRQRGHAGQGLHRRPVPDRVRAARPRRHRR